MFSSSSTNQDSLHDVPNSTSSEQSSDKRPEGGGQDIGSVTTGGSSGPHLLPPVVSLCLKSLLFSMRFGAYHQPLNPSFNHQLL